MATSAFKSTTKRNTISSTSTSDDTSSSTKTHRRSRSLSRFSHRPPETSDVPPSRSGKFVNTVRGSGFPEISLDDLALECFPLKDSLPVDERESRERGRIGRRSSDVGRWASDTASSSQRRGRSVSRQSGCSGGGEKVGSEAISRRRRSVSVVRYQISDSESDIDRSRSSSNHVNIKSSAGGTRQMPLSQKPTALNHRQLGRSLSQKDLSKSFDGYSSHSSAITDDEARDSRFGRNAIEKTIQAVYAQKKGEHPIGDDMNSGLYEAMRKELRYAVEEIRTEIEQAMVRKTAASASGECLQLDNTHALQAVSAIRSNYATKLEQSDKRKQELFAEIALEEQRGRELSKIVREFLPNAKDPVVPHTPSRARKRSNDRNRMSKRLTDEAEKYLEDFISNIEDADISSFDGEKSDASSSLGGITTKPRERDTATLCRETAFYQSPPAGPNSLPVEMDGVILPWLQWETIHDGSPLPGKNRTLTPVTPKPLLWDAAQDVPFKEEMRNHSASSRGSWSPELVDNHSVIVGEASGSKSRELASTQRSHFDMAEYLKLQTDEDLLFERWRERHRINSGGLMLCGSWL